MSDKVFSGDPRDIPPDFDLPAELRGMSSRQLRAASHALVWYMDVACAYCHVPLDMIHLFNQLHTVIDEDMIQKAEALEAKRGEA